ncbi:MAG: hypothetical protein WD342_09340 [Verrucomicrobiales bacterium]
MKTSLSFFLLLIGLLPAPVRADAPSVPAGAARIDITPEDPVQLINVKEPTESERVGRKLFARALAMGAGEKAVVLLGYDGIGVPATLAERVAGRITEEHGLPRDRIALCASHTHWAPHLTDLLTGIYGGPLPEDHQKRVDAYTDLLADRLVAVAGEALAARQPSRLAWTTGRVTFAANRRMEEGGRLLRDPDRQLMVTWNPEAPVDHTLPVLSVRDAATGDLTALHFTYACHNVAITGSLISGFENTIHGDWVGLTLEEIERRHPGCVAIGTIGCGGDQRPDFCGDEGVAMAHAREIADEVDRLLGDDTWQTFGAPEAATMDRTELPLEPMPSEETLREYVNHPIQTPPTAARAHVARNRLDQIEAGEETPDGVPFLSQSWRFADGGPTFVFMAGEVCIDFQLRIRKEHGPGVWPVAYANATPCYIVSRRMVERGGYEAGNSMFYYGWLRPFQPEVEDLVMQSVARVLEGGAE